MYAASPDSFTTRPTMQDAPPPPAAPDQRQEFQERLRQTIEDATAAAQAGVGQGGAGGAAAAPVGIATTQPQSPWHPYDDVPPRAQETAIAFFIMLAVMVIGYPIAKAFGRRIDRAGTSTKLPSEVTSQLAQLNQAVESIAIEVERISEGQRFTTKLLSEQQKLPPPNSNVP